MHHQVSKSQSTEISPLKNYSDGIDFYMDNIVFPTNVHVDRCFSIFLINSTLFNVLVYPATPTWVQQHEDNAMFCKSTICNKNDDYFK